MKNLFVLIILSLISVPVFGQDVDPVETETVFSAALEFFLPALLGSIIMLISDAQKWIGSGMWDWTAFWSTKVKPFLITVAGAIGLYFAILYVPALKRVVEALSQVDLTEFTAFTLFAAVQGLLNGFLKPKEPKEPVAA